MHINSNIQAIAGAYTVNASHSMKRMSAMGKAGVRDEVHISSDGQSFSSMLKKLKGMDDARPDKVEFYTKAIEDGAYDVSSANIASRMLGFPVGY